jgi:hypothetical protein
MNRETEIDQTPRGAKNRQQALDREKDFAREQEDMDRHFGDAGIERLPRDEGAESDELMEKFLDEQEAETARRRDTSIPGGEVKTVPQWKIDLASATENSSAGPQENSENGTPTERMGSTQEDTTSNFSINKISEQPQGEVEPKQSTTPPGTAPTTPEGTEDAHPNEAKNIIDDIDAQLLALRQGRGGRRMRVRIDEDVPQNKPLETKPNETEQKLAPAPESMEGMNGEIEQTQTPENKDTKMPSNEEAPQAPVLPKEETPKIKVSDAANEEIPEASEAPEVKPEIVPDETSGEETASGTQPKETSVAQEASKTPNSEKTPNKLPIQEEAGLRRWGLERQTNEAQDNSSEQKSTPNEPKNLPTQLQSGERRWGLNDEKTETSPEDTDALRTKLKELSEAAYDAKEKGNIDAFNRAQNDIHKTAAKLREQKKRQPEVGEKQPQNEAPKNETGEEAPADPVVANPEKKAQKESPAQEDEKEKKPDMLSAESLQDFTVEGEGGEKIRFGDLSEGKQKLVIETFRQLGYQEIKIQALKEHREEKSAIAGELGLSKSAIGNIRQMIVHAPTSLKLMGKGLFKGKDVAQKEKDLQAKIFEGDVSDSELLTKTIQQVSEGPEMTINPETGKTELEYLSSELFPGVNEKGKSQIAKMNQLANAYASIPASWKDASKHSMEYKKFLDSKSAYETQKKHVLEAADHANEADRASAFQKLSELDMKVGLNQLLSSNPEIEKAVLEVRDQNVWKEAFKDIGKSRGKFMAMGFVARTMAGYGLGVMVSGGALISAPLVASGLGALRGRKRANTEMEERDELTRAGEGKSLKDLYGEKQRANYRDLDGDLQYSESKSDFRDRTDKALATKMSQTGMSIENVANASGEGGLAGKLNALVEQINNTPEENEEARAKLLSSLSARVKYTQNKIEQ